LWYNINRLKEVIRIPEIVEVQVQVDGLQRILGQKIRKVQVNEDSTRLLNVHPETFQACLEGSTIDQIWRTGKYIVWELGKDLEKSKSGKKEQQWQYLVTHLIMTGGYMVNKLHPHERIIYELSRDTLYYGDKRKWSHVNLFDTDELKFHFKKANLGIDTLMANKLEIEKEMVEKIYQRKYMNKAIKEILLDQTVISGLGNIYVAEVLHHANIHPLDTPGHLSWGDLETISESIKYIIPLAYSVRGSSIKDYTDTSGEGGGFAKLIKVYGKAGQICKTCNCQNIHVVVIKGRKSFFCPYCQPRR
jgi:formamidopyrimidine-DNA glycosylase